MKRKSFPFYALVGRADEDEEQMMVVLRYEPAMPWSVKVILPGAEVMTSRDLLSEGLTECSGDEAVMVGPDEDDPGVIVMMLRIPSPATAILYVRVSFQHGPYAKALFDMNRMVPRGHEHQFMDWGTGMEICEAA